MQRMTRPNINAKACNTHSYVTTIGEIDRTSVGCCLEKNGKLACCDRKEEQQEEHAEPVTDLGEVMAKLKVLFQIHQRIRILL